MAPFWCFLAGLGILITAVVALYWRHRALEAERHAEANLDALRMWQEIATDWSEKVQALSVEVDEAGIGERVPGGPGYGPRNRAQLFNLISETFYHQMLEWNPRHD